MIAKLAEGRKVQKSIYDFGPVALSSKAKPVSTVATCSVSSGNPDLLGSILASQTQLSEFGKPADGLRTKIRTPSNSSRVLAAILASRATLNRLDEDIARLQSQSKSTVMSKDVGRSNGRQQSNDQQKSDQQSNSNSNNCQQSSGASSSNNQSNALGSNGQTVGTNGGSDGNDEDPNENQKKKISVEAADAEDEESKEEEVDLYSDIESVEEESDPPQIQHSSKVVEVINYFFLIHFTYLFIFLFSRMMNECSKRMMIRVWSLMTLKIQGEDQLNPNLVMKSKVNLPRN